jgi:hypothetical protein
VPKRKHHRNITPELQVFTIDQFCDRHGICRSTVYHEHTRGRLRISKIGSKSVIRIEDEKAWRDSLPALGASS